MDVQAKPSLVAAADGRVRRYAAFLGLTFAAVVLVAFAYTMLWLILVELPVLFR
jgi:hypothetical protein